MSLTNAEPNSFSPTHRAGRLWVIWLTLALTLPWLSPYTAGPTPNVWPWLISAACAVMLWLCQHRLSARLVAGGWVVAAGLSALIALLQYFGLAPDFSPWISQTQVGEAFGNLRQRNQLATLMSIGMIALVALVALPQVQRPGQVSAGSRSTPWWALASALLLAVGNAVSSSRTGLLQWLLIAVLTAWWVLPGGKRLLVFVLQALLAYGMAVLLLPWLLELLTSVQTGGLLARLAEVPTCGSRKVLWSNVLMLIVEKPWLGWGWNELDYAHFITLYPGLRFCEILDNAHNLPLHLAVELGVPAAVAICGALSWMVWRARPWAETDPTRQMAWAVLAVIGLHSLLEYPLWYGPFQIAVVLCVMLLWRPAAVCETSTPLKKQEKSTVIQVFTALIATILIACIAYAAWDYRRVSQIYLEYSERDLSLRDNTLVKISGTKLFRNQFLFAQLSMTPLTVSNAQWTYDTATSLLHYSPEPRVIEKVIESATLLGLEAQAVAHLARYRAAFPKDHAQWSKRHSLGTLAR